MINLSKNDIFFFLKQNNLKNSNILFLVFETLFLVSLFFFYLENKKVFFFKKICQIKLPLSITFSIFSGKLILKLTNLKKKKNDFFKIFIQKLMIGFFFQTPLKNFKNTDLFFYFISLYINLIEFSFESLKFSLWLFFFIRKKNFFDKYSILTCEKRVLKIFVKTFSIDVKEEIICIFNCILNKSLKKKKNIDYKLKATKFSKKIFNLNMYKIKFKNKKNFVKKKFFILKKKYKISEENNKYIFFLKNLCENFAFFYFGSLKVFYYFKSKKWSNSQIKLKEAIRWIFFQFSLEYFLILKKKIIKKISFNFKEEIQALGELKYWFFLNKITSEKNLLIKFILKKKRTKKKIFYFFAHFFFKKKLFNQLFLLINNFFKKKKEYFNQRHFKKQSNYESNFITFFNFFLFVKSIQKFNSFFFFSKKNQFSKIPLHVNFQNIKKKIISSSDKFFYRINFILIQLKQIYRNKHKKYCKKFYFEFLKEIDSINFEINYTKKFNNSQLITYQINFFKYILAEKNINIQIIVFFLNNNFHIFKKKKDQILNKIFNIFIVIFSFQMECFWKILEKRYFFQKIIRRSKNFFSKRKKIIILITKNFFYKTQKFILKINCLYVLNTILICYINSIFIQIKKINLKIENLFFTIMKIFIQCKRASNENFSKKIQKINKKIFLKTTFDIVDKYRNIHFQKQKLQKLFKKIYYLFLILHIVRKKFCLKFDNFMNSKKKKNYLKKIIYFIKLSIDGYRKSKIFNKIKIVMKMKKFFLNCFLFLEEKKIILKIKKKNFFKFHHIKLLISYLKKFFPKHSSFTKFFFFPDLKKLLITK
jgi:hypothetical protein